MGSQHTEHPELLTYTAFRQLDALDLHERLKDYGYASIMQGSSIIQGGALATAAVALVGLFGPGVHWLLWLMWISSLVGINAIYVSYIRAAIMEPEDGRSGQVAMMFVGVGEMLQFAVLRPARPWDDVSLEWLLVTALGGTALIWEAFKRARRLESGAYAEELGAVLALARRTGWRRVRAMSGLVLCLIATAAAIAVGVRGSASELTTAAAVGAYGLLSLAVNVQVHRERITTARGVTEALSARSGPSRPLRGACDGAA